MILAAAIGFSQPPPARAAETGGAFVMTVNADTIALERFTRSGDQVTGALAFRLTGLRFDYALTLAPGGGVRHMENAVRPASATLAAPPTQSATLDWSADSVIAEVHPGGVQRLGTRAGSVPYLNPSILLLELIVQRALSATPPLDSVPVFAVAGGRTLLMAVRRVRADSVVVGLGGAEFQLRLGADREIVSGGVPAQGVSFRRIEVLPERLLAMAPPDYSPPAGAPYTAERVRVPTRGGFELVGTLTRPRKPGRVPCVVTITGSGQQERDEALLIVRGYRPFRQIADTLARRGIAVLRLDDRGTGESGGVVAGSTSVDFADDVEDALRWLRHAGGIDSTRLALLGHSEGGLIAPLVAARGVPLRGMVLLAGPAWTGRRIMEYQNTQLAKKKYSGASLDSVMRLATHAVDSLAAAEPWVGYFARHDPLEVARTLKSPPVLVLQGATDRQVAAEQAPELAGAFKRAGNPDVTLRVLPATNHLFLPDPSGDPAGYSALRVSEIPRATLGIIADWLAARLRP
ncbi:MAG TPA: alpha/beta hydrolase [Candidatus Eisenbacteria bacterium]